MILAHLSDLHLGFRAYGRVENGMDLRERDVAAAFERAVSELIRLRPDVIVVAGDVFDRPDPAASAVVALARGLETLRASLPDTPVLMVAGPRDTPRSEGDPGALAVLDTFSNVEAATSLTRSILIDRLDLHVCLVPHRAVVRQPPVLPEPDPRRRWNVLVLHALASAPAADVGIPVDAGEWSYVALGGEHRRRDVDRHVVYSGSLERVAPDPWDEATDEKGFVVVDLESGRVRFHAVAGRPVAALAPVKVSGREPERIRRRVREVTAELPGGIDGKIVRLRLQGADPRDLLALQGTLLEDLRGRALHLSVEAGRELRPPPESWLAAEAPRALREAVALELEREGRLDDAAEAVLEAWIGDEAEGPTLPIGALDTLDGDVPGLGRVSTSIPRGVTGIFGGAGRARRALTDLLLARVDEAGAGAVGTLWRRVGVETLEQALHDAAAAVAESRGMRVIDEALARAGVSLDAEWSLGEPTRMGDELLAADRQLRELRADVAEVDGDLEVATMDWLRERQDAETTLHAYRDRARALRARLRRMEEAGPDAPCPTCGRVLAEHHEEVLAELREEWESIVQDGSWWRSRWAQLETKPAALRELEGRSVRLHAALESASERAELLRARAASAEAEPALSARAAELNDRERAVLAALARVRAARLRRATELVLDRASRFLCRLSGGRVLAVTRDDGRVLLQGTAAVLTPLADEDLALANLALRLAGASLSAASGRVLASLPITESFDRLDEETRHRALVLLKALVREIPRLVIVTRGASVGARPELFDYLLEVRDEGASPRPLARPTPAGPGWVSIRERVRRRRATAL